MSDNHGHTALNLQPTNLANRDATYANQAAHACSCMHVCLHEQSLSNNNAPYPINFLFADNTCNAGAAETLNTENPRFERRKIEDGHLPDMAPPGQLSSSTVLTVRSSIASGSTAPTSTDWSSTMEQAYDCPVCAMGKRDAPRKCIRKAQATADGNCPTKRPKSFKYPACFNRHIKDLHLELFRRTNSSEFTCLFCPCGSVIDRPDCSARCKDTGDLLQHLRAFHSKPTILRNRFDHLCAPLFTQSYSQRFLRKAKGCTGFSSILK